MKSRMFAVFCIGALVATISLGAIQYVAASSGSTITACANKSTGAMRLLTKGKCKKTERSIQWNQQGVPGPQGIPGPQGSQAASMANSGSLNVIDATGQVLGPLISTDIGYGYSFFKDEGVWTVHPGIQDYSAMITNYYSNMNCSSPIGVVRYPSETLFSTVLNSERYVVKRGNSLTGYKPTSSPFLGSSVSSVYQWSTAMNRCVQTSTTGSLSTTVFVPLVSVTMQTYTAPLSIVHQ